MSFEEFKSIKIDDETPLVTFDEFKNCITNNPVWYKTERRGWSLYKLIDVRGSVDKHFEYFLKTCRYAGIKEKWEAAQLLAHVIHETKGLQLFEEQIESRKGNKNLEKISFHSGICFFCKINIQGKWYGIYYGRGAIFMSWQNRYKQASKALFPKEPNKLWKTPEALNQVRDDIELGWAVAAWCWKTLIHPIVKDNYIEASTFKLKGEYLKPESDFVKHLAAVHNEILNQLHAIKGT